MRFDLLFELSFEKYYAGNCNDKNIPTQQQNNFVRRLRITIAQIKQHSEMRNDNNYGTDYNK